MNRRQFLATTASGTIFPIHHSLGQTQAITKKIRILNYNIYAGRNQDDSFDLTRIADVIQSARPDMVALQEVDKNTARNQGNDIGKILAEKLEMHYAFGRAIDYQGGQYGNGMLSRFPITEHFTHALDGDGGEDRCGLECMITLPGINKPLNVISLHLCHQNAHRRMRQLETLKHTIKADGWCAQIMAGDFNDQPDTQFIQDFIATGWCDLAPETHRNTPTFSSCNPRRRIDYFFARTPFPGKVSNYSVGPELMPECTGFPAKLALASDHLPLLLEFQLHEKPRNP